MLGTEYAVKKTALQNSQNTCQQDFMLIKMESLTKPAINVNRGLNDSVEIEKKFWEADFYLTMPELKYHSDCINY